jgi:hypothetical protein
MIREFIAWLNERFPPLCVVSRDDYLKLWSDLNQLRGAQEVFIGDLAELSKAITGLETQIKRLNQSQGFTQTPQGPMRLER